MMGGLTEDLVGPYKQYILVHRIRIKSYIQLLLSLFENTFFPMPCAQGKSGNQNTKASCNVAVVLTVLQSEDHFSPLNNHYVAAIVHNATR